MPRCGRSSVVQRSGSINRRLRSPFACSQGDLPLPKSLKGAILASKPPGSGECRVKSRMLRRLYNFIGLAAILETTHGRRDQTEDTDALGPTPDHDDCHAKAGWVAAGDDRRLRERKSNPLLPLPPG
jgi:hypothetical protein